MPLWVFCKAYVPVSEQKSAECPFSAATADLRGKQYVVVRQSGPQCPLRCVGWF